MRGKSWSIPASMVFRKSYCHKCGTKLNKEKIHRVVTKDDPDYYYYQEVGNYPKYDYDVYSYRFCCPQCGNKITAKEQDILRRIQKKTGTNIVSSLDIDSNYDIAKKKENRSVKITNILIPNIMLLIVFVIMYFVDALKEDWEYYLIMTILFEVFIIVGNTRSHKGKHRLFRKPSYTYERKELLQKLHTYSSNNKELIMKANRVHCFHCKSNMSYRDIKEYIDNDSTGLCPYCGIDSLLPDSIDDNIDDSIIEDMNKYWF